MQFQHRWGVTSKQITTNAGSKFATDNFEIYDTFSSCLDIVFLRIRSANNTFHILYSLYNLSEKWKQNYSFYLPHGC